MRNQASANAESCSRAKNRKSHKKKIAVIFLVAAGIFSLIYYSSVSLSDFAGRKLSILLGAETKIGRIRLNSCRSLLLENVDIRSKGISISARKVFIDFKVQSLLTGRLKVEKVTIDSAFFSLEKRTLHSTLLNKKVPEGPIPSIVIRHGKLAVEGKGIVNIKYLNLEGFISPCGFTGEIFGNVDFFLPWFRNFPVKVRGKASVSKMPAGSADKSKMFGRVFLQKLEIGSFCLSKIRTKIEFYHGKLSLNGFGGEAYNGLLSGWAVIEKNKYSAAFNALGLDLKTFSSAIAPDGKDITGRLDMQGKLEGNPGDCKTWHGSGSAVIRDGQLWNIPILYGLAALMMKPAFRDEIFKQGSVDFRISNGKIATKNLELTGDRIGLAAQGALGFDQKLDFTVTTIFTRELKAKGHGVVEVTSAISNIVDFLLIRYYIKGTIKKPSYEIIPFPVLTAIPLQIKKIIRTLFPKTKVD